MVSVPDGFEDLLTRPLWGDFATVRPDGDPSVTPMWFSWDGERLHFTHSKQRQKLKHIEHNPHIAFVIRDPDKPERYLQVRGAVEEVTPDPTGAFHVELQARYGVPNPTPPANAPDRVIISVRPFAYTQLGGRPG